MNEKLKKEFIKLDYFTFGWICGMVTCFVLLRLWGAI